ncbi:hypothetical protein [Arsenicibacter rosenii]|uniref:Uncharacterized protein n=1 Tax=Arsenicibacter rosenii TaxID=1750698 RepID=A0A1S2V9T3_9BACT|nr:hypothetical protein [Arsenicibacter rosenii]OIN55494.1 hypothetical protein BLX24_30055 [Arsenicibacter rosenii]
MNLTQLKGAADLAQLRYDADPSEQNKEKLKAAQEAYAAKAEATADTPETGGTSVTEAKSSNPPADTAKTGVTSGNTAQSSGIVEKAVPDPAATPDGTGSAGSPEEKKSE